MVDFENKPSYDVYDLQKLMELLRGTDGCPWDSAQTHASIRRNLLEEAFEAAEAIDEDDTDHLVEELGDVLMQVVFHADIADKAGRFNLNDIADATCRKLIRRHPHVFGDVKAQDSNESLLFWEDIKRSENSQATVADSMRSIAQSLPALWLAEKIQKKASKVGFDWPDYSGAFDVLQSELGELETAISSGAGVEGELGDLLFSIVNIARFFDIDPEEALRGSCEKFVRRFSLVERAVLSSGASFEALSLEELEEYYQSVKLKENST